MNIDKYTSRMIWVLCSLLSVLAQPALSATYATTTGGVTTKGQAVGLNLSGLTYHDSDVPFVDLMKMSKGWQRPLNAPAEEKAIPVKITPDGYPLEIAPSPYLVNVVSTDVWGRPADENVYKLSWDGKGTVVPPGAIVSSGENQVIFELRKSTALMVKLTAVDPANPVRNMQMIPVNSSGQPMYSGKWRQRYIDSLANMKVLRFMDWGQTNNSLIKEWSERHKGGQATIDGPQDVAYEDIIELANLTGKNVWVNIPHLASDDYVAQMARLFSAKLKPGLIVYVEYSNETWNSAFKQTKYIASQAALLGLKQPEAYAKRVLEVADIWRNNFSPRQNAKIVMAAQYSKAWIAERALAYKDAGHKVDALAIAPYLGFGPKRYTEMTDWLQTATPAQLIARMKAELLPELRLRLEEHAALAKQYGIPLVAYEGGQHLAGPDPTMQNNQTITDLFIATNRDPGMADLYMSLMYEWQRVGGGLFVFFTSTYKPGKYGSWGLREQGGQSIKDSYKLQGVYKYCGWPVQ